MLLRRERAWHVEVENVGFRFPILRHYYLDKLSLPCRRGLQKPNNGGLFAPDLMTGFTGSGAVWLSPRPFLSKAVDSRF
jgi:hypothetical protein